MYKFVLEGGNYFMTRGASLKYVSAYNAVTIPTSYNVFKSLNFISVSLRRRTLPTSI